MITEKEHTRTHIRNTTAKLIAELGFSGVKTKKIAEACQVSDGLIFKYFKSLDGLFTEVCEHCVKQFTNFAIDANMSSNQEMLQAFTFAFFEHNLNQPESFLIYMRSVYERKDLLEKIPAHTYNSGLMQEIEFRFVSKYGEVDGLLLFRAFRNMLYQEIFNTLLEKNDSPFATKHASYRLSLLFFPE